MSKKFKSQDYFRYKKLGKRWRRPVGWQSKLRLRKGGSGKKVSIGYGSPKEGELDEIIVVKNLHDVSMAKGKPVMIASAVGAKNTLEIMRKAKELDSRIVNAKKVKRAVRISRKIEEKKKKKHEKKKDEHKGHKEGAGEKKEEKHEDKEKPKEKTEHTHEKKEEKEEHAHHEKVNEEGEIKHGKMKSEERGDHASS